MADAEPTTKAPSPQDRKLPLYLLTPSLFVWLWALGWFGSTARATGATALFFLSFATLDQVLRRVFRETGGRT